MADAVPSPQRASLGGSLGTGLGTGSWRDFRSDVIGLEVDDHVATVLLDNPERRNAMGPAFWTDLPAAIAAAESDPEVRVVVIAANGPHFTVGLDLKSMGSGGRIDGESQAQTRLRSYHDIKQLQRSISTVADSRLPVIVAVHGYCIGGGIDLIAACDIRLASCDAVFSVRETRVAITADVGTLQRLPKVISAGHVAELVFTGKDIDAERARTIGLVNDVAADREAVIAAAHAMAAEIAANSPLSVQGSKAVLRASEAMTVEQGLDYVAVWNAAFLPSDDLVEAMTAFVEKRPSEFRGR